MPVNQLLQPIENVDDNYVNHTNTADVPIDIAKATAVATAAADHVDTECKPDLNIHALLSECLPVQTPFETRSNACLSLNGPSSTADALYQLNPPPLHLPPTTKTNHSYEQCHKKVSLID